MYKKFLKIEDTTMLQEIASSNSCNLIYEVDMEAFSQAARKMGVQCEQNLSKILFMSCPFREDARIYFTIFDREKLDSVKDMAWKYYDSFSRGKYIIGSKRGEILHRLIRCGQNSKGNGVEVHHMGHCFDNRCLQTVSLPVNEHKQIGKRRQYEGELIIRTAKDFVRFCATL